VSAVLEATVIDNTLPGNSTQPNQQHVAHTATHCNTLQHTATHSTQPNQRFQHSRPDRDRLMAHATGD